MAVGFPTKANWAAGDILTAAQMDDLAGTVNTLSPVGQANGSTLVANSANASGLGWNQNFAAGKNKIINGDFGIWQRGTSFTANGYNADRWTLAQSVLPTTWSISRQTFTPGTAPVSGYEGKYFLRYSVTTIGSGVDYYFGQLIEDVQTFAGQTMTYSIWLKADSARSVSLQYNQNFGSGGSTTVNGTLGTFAVTTAWTRFTATVAIPSIAGKTVGTSSYLQFYFSGTPASGLALDFWGAQAEAGSVATAFQTATGTLQGELGACQRYYYATQTGTSTYIGYAYATNGTIYDVPFPVSMRTNPTALVTSGTCSAYALNASTAITPTFDKASVNSAQILGAITIVAGQGSRIECGANNIGFSAEL